MRPSHAVLALSTLVAPASADVITVGPSGADHTQIQPAIDAAAPGDIVLLRAAPMDHFQGFTIAGKGVAIFADTLGLSYVNGTVVIRDVPAGPAVVLRQLACGGSEVQSLRVTSCAGPVRFEWTNAGAFLAGSLADFDTVATITDCADVAGANFAVQGADVLNQPSTLTGLRLERSRLSATSSTFRGTRGTAGSGLGGVLLPGGTGTPALHVVDSQVFLRGGELSGGSGGNGLSACQLPTLVPTAGGDGGPAISIQTGSVFLRGSDIRGGYAGPGGFGGVNCASAPNGAPGAALDDPNGLVTQTTGPVRTLRTMRTVVREGQSLEIQVTTAPGDVVYLALGRRTGIGNTPSIEGESLLVSRVERRLLGTATGNGLIATIPFGELGAGIEGQLVHMQAVVYDANGQGSWTNLSTVAWVDSSL